MQGVGGKLLIEEEFYVSVNRLWPAHKLGMPPSEKRWAKYNASFQAEAHTPASLLEQIALGYNYRMTDIQAALGLSQMQRLDEFVAKRHTIAQRYDDALNDSPVTTPWRNPDDRSAMHLYVIRLKCDEIRMTHLKVFDALRAAGIGVNLHYIPVYRQPYYERLGFKPSGCLEAERYYGEAISLPMYPGLSQAQQDKVLSTLRTALM